MKVSKKLMGTLRHYQHYPSLQLNQYSVNGMICFTGIGYEVNS
jgi:hypothetical protein